VGASAIGAEAGAMTIPVPLRWNEARDVIRAYRFPR